ncbi:MAG: hypothetical protein AB1346_06985 [Thermodesulfobacteriota bacterium]
MPGGRRVRPRRLAAYALGAALFLCVFLLTVALTLPGDLALSLLRPGLEARGIRLSAENSRLLFPLGVRLNGVTLDFGGNRQLSLDELSAAWEWTGLFRWLPAHLRCSRGDSVVDIRLSPAFWSPSRGRVIVAGVSSEQIPLPVFTGSGAGLSVRKADVHWTGSGNSLAATGAGDFEFLLIPMPAGGSPIREARIDNAAMTFVVRGSSLHVPRLQGSYEGSRVEGTGEVAKFLTPGSATVTFHLSIRNPFEGRVGILFDMLAKNAKNANLRIVGSLTAPKAEIELF